MSERSIKIRIGASVDRNLSNVFPSMEAAARRARATIQTEMNAAFTGVARDAKGRFVGSTVGAIRDVEAAAKRAGPAIKTPLIQAVDEITKGSRAKFAAMRQDFDLYARDAERALERVDRAQRRYSATQSAPSRAALSAIGKGSVRAGRALFGAARSIGSSLASGSGVQLDLAGMVNSNAHLETGATNLSNSGFMPGEKGANGSRVDPRALMKDARSVGIANAFDPNEVMGGLQKFVGKTGDLETGRNVIGDLAKLSKATGTNLDDMADAAGDVANALGTVGNKGELVQKVMQTVAAQGKRGAVEIKDMAVQMAKIAASAGAFEGGGAKNIGMLGAIAQESRAKGGSASATQAATSVMGFVNTFSKGARLRAFKGFGVDVHTAAGNLQSPDKIIQDALKAASSSRNGGMANFSLNMGKMFMDASARRATRGFENIYTSAYAKAGGTEQERMAEAAKAVREEFSRLATAMMDGKEIEASFNKAMNTTESRVTVFNAQLAATAAEMTSALLPAMKVLGPAAIGAANALSKVLAKITGKTGDVESDEFGDELAVVTGGRKFLGKKSEEAAELGLTADEWMTDKEKEELLRGVGKAQGAVKEERDRADGTTVFGGVTKAILNGIDYTPFGAAYNGITGKNVGADIVGGREEDVKTHQFRAETLAAQTDKLAAEIANKIREKPLPVAIHADHTHRPPSAPNHPAVRTGQH